MADRLRHVGTWLSLVEHSLGVRGVGSSNLPVPTISVVTVQIPLSAVHSRPTHEAPQPAPQRQRRRRVSLRGARGEAEPFGSSNLPVPTIQFYRFSPLSAQYIPVADPRSTPTCAAAKRRRRATPAQPTATFSNARAKNHFTPGGWPASRSRNGANQMEPHQFPQC